MADDDSHPCQQKGKELTSGQEVLFNDRSRPLVVVDRHERQQTSSTWRRRGEDKYHTVIELEGNGTEYHLLCTGGSSNGPMLYKKSDWRDEPDKLGNRPSYPRAGERVEHLHVV